MYFVDIYKIKIPTKLLENVRILRLLDNLPHLNVAVTQSH